VDRDGVLAFEWVLLVTLLTIGIVSGLAGAPDAIIDELGDVAQAMLALISRTPSTFLEVISTLKRPALLRIRYLSTRPLCGLRTIGTPMTSRLSLLIPSLRIPDTWSLGHSPD
jgi:hypothetical protein